MPPRLIARMALVILAFTPASSWAAQQPVSQVPDGSGTQEAQANQTSPNADTQEEDSARPPTRGHAFIQLIRGDENPPAANRGSPYVPLDSWIYPALERLVSVGLVDSAFVGMRPWTRIACAQMVSQAQDQIDRQTGQANEVTSEIVDELAHEFSAELEVIDGKADAPVTRRSEWNPPTVAPNTSLGCP
jgi:hypothetical protein